MTKDRKGWIEISIIGAIVGLFTPLTGCGGNEKTSPPISPTNLQATAISSSQVDLSWVDNSDDEEGFKIERKTSDGSYSLIKTYPADVTSFSDTGLTPATTYSYQVKAYDSVGDSDYSNEANATTLAPPDTTITSQPSNPTNQPSANFNFTSSDTSSNYECQLDGGGYLACISPKSYDGLSDGSHIFSVRAIDLAGSTDQTPASYTWTIDTVSPGTTITSQPYNPTNQTSASFSFSSTDGGSIYECKLDSGTWEVCVPPKSYPGPLTEGDHFFSVRATDLVGNTNPSPAQYSWTISFWQTTSLLGMPDGRYWHTAVWTGIQMIIWGGEGSDYLNTGGRYNPTTDIWVATSTIGVPSGRKRIFNTTIWTGTQMIVWGGVDTLGSHPTNGGRYNPLTDTWVATSTTGVPSGREDHTAVWTGTEMVVWGGYDGNNRLGSGGRYDPSTDTWLATSTTGAPSARNYHTAVWAGTEMIIWGGYGGGGNNGLNTGGRYNPSTDSWVTTSLTGVPEGRLSHTAVWTGAEMIIWGGLDNDLLNTGGRYNPSTDTWVATSTIGAPSGRQDHTVVWTGTEMVAWGGRYGSSSCLNTGGRYNPSTDIWVATPTIGAPSARELHTAVWTGIKMIVWGGHGDSNILNTGGQYTP